MKRVVFIIFFAATALLMCTAFLACGHDMECTTNTSDNDTVSYAESKSETEELTHRYTETSAAPKQAFTETNSEINMPPTLAERTAWNITLSVKEVYAGDRLIYVDITDYDNQGFSIGMSDFELERYDDSQWINITASQADGGKGDVFPKDDGISTVTMRLYVSKLSAEPLENGRYRLSVNLNGHRVSTEFDVLP